MEFNTLARRRESCRKYDPAKPVSREDILEVIETAATAPSACNSQPWRFVLVQGEKAASIPKLLQGGGFNHFADDISTFVILCEAPAKLMSALSTMDQQRYAQIDIGSAATMLTLAAEDKGIASCIMGYFEEPELKALYGIQDKIRLVLGFGYAAVPEKRTKSRKPMEDVLRII